MVSTFAFKRPTRTLNFTNRDLILITFAFELAIRGSELSELVTRKTELETCMSELVTHSS